MARRLLLPILLAIALVPAGSPSGAAAATSIDAIPGSYVVTITGRLRGGTYFTKLAMYSFQPGERTGTRASGTMREDFWYWQSNGGQGYGNTDRMVGYVSDPSYVNNVDQTKFIQGVQPFDYRAGLRTPLTLYGTWLQYDNLIQVYWSWGDAETWLLTWEDNPTTPLLYKIELIYASYLPDSIYLSVTGARDKFAFNAGWGFGSAGWGFTYGKTIWDIDDLKDYVGLYRRFNAWAPGTESDVRCDEMNLRSAFLGTTSGAFRHVELDPIASQWVFSYFAQPILDNGGMNARRVMYQISHDFGGNHYISDDKGHIYSGLEIIDADGELRGFVFSDSSPNRNLPRPPVRRNTISSLFYLDVPGTAGCCNAGDCCDALYGVNPDDPAEPCP